MVIYFKKHDGVNFIDRIESGVKIHTCRRSRIPADGSTLYLRCGRSFVKAVCSGKQAVVISNGDLLIDGRKQDGEQFAKNGGFDSYGVALSFYGQNYLGFIIHFTRFRY